MICYDLLDVLNLVSAEQAARRILMIGRAVRRSPKSPDFEGLDGLLSNQFDSPGGVLTRHFDKYISEIQKNDTTVLQTAAPVPRGGRGRRQAEEGQRRRGGEVASLRARAPRLRRSSRLSANSMQSGRPCHAHVAEPPRRPSSASCATSFRKPPFTGTGDCSVPAPSFWLRPTHR